MSDMELVKQSGFLGKLERSHVVLADKGFIKTALVLYFEGTN